MSIYNKQRRESVNIILSNTDSAPIYEQITRQLRAKIVSGELTAGQALFLINWNLSASFFFIFYIVF